MHPRYTHELVANLDTKTLRFATVSIRAGIPVTIRGLKAESAVQYNGQSGSIESYDSAKGRYVVKLDDKNEPNPVYIFPSNLDSL